MLKDSVSLSMAYDLTSIKLLLKERKKQCDVER